MAWQETSYFFTEDQYEIVTPPAEVSPVGALQVVANTTDCTDIRMALRIWEYGGGDEYTNTIQYFDQSEQQWVEIPLQISCGGSGGPGARELTPWYPLPGSAVGSAVTFRPIGVEGDSTTSCTVSNWEIIVRKQV